MREILIIAMLCGIAASQSVANPESKEAKTDERIFSNYGGSNTDFSSISLASPFDIFNGLNFSDIGLDLFGMNSGMNTLSTPTVSIASALAAVGGGLAGVFGIFILPLQVATQILAIVAIAMFIAVYSQNDDAYGLDYALNTDSYSDSYDSVVSSYTDGGDWLNTARSMASSPFVSSLSNLVYKGIQKYADMQ